MLLIDIVIGFSDIMNSFSLKNEVKIRLIIVFFFRLEICCSINIVKVVSFFEKNVLKVNGSFSIQVFVMLGMIEWLSVLLISDYFLSIKQVDKNVYILLINVDIQIVVVIQLQLKGKSRLVIIWCFCFVICDVCCCRILVGVYYW